MSLETSEKILKVSGFLAITGGILAIIGGIMSMVMGGAATQMPEVTSNPEYQKGMVGLLLGGGAEAIGGIISLFEGGTSLSAAKDGKHATAAWVFALVGLIGSILRGLSYILKKQLTQTITISIILAIVLSLIIFIAAGNVKRANQENQ